MKVILYTGFALLAFALNSILCRLALGGGEAGAASFAAVRLASGAVMLAIIAASIGKAKKAAKSGHWSSAFFLFLYAIAFSFAYLGLTAGTGALILFGCVQITIIGAAMIRGNRPGPFEWVGLIVAFAGLVWLVLPGLESPPLLSSLLMAVAGIAWGFYTILGKVSTDPIIDTAGNFIRSVPMVLLAVVPFAAQAGISTRGLVFAVLSGAVTSGLGYTAWYAALKYHTPTRTAVMQLSVPVLVAILGLALLHESAGSRMIVSGVLVLGGIAMTLAKKK